VVKRFTRKGGIVAADIEQVEEVEGDELEEGEDLVDVDCMCRFEKECSGTGVLHCAPPCGGDNCICVCGGERECDGCDNCDTDHDRELVVELDDGECDD
jgi:hypothetical protein